MIKKSNKFFKSSEEAISMFLGLVIVVVVIGLVINFFSRRKGIINLPGSKDNISLEEDKAKMLNGGGEYVVVAGDNLWKIAVAKYNDGYKWVEIAKANKLANAGKIEKGQKLIIPEIKAAVAEKPTIETSDYVVKKGDNLWKIAVAKYNDGYKWVEIYKANKAAIRNPGLIEIGMKLILP